MANLKQITNIATDTQTVIGMSTGTTELVGITLVDLQIYKEASFEIYENNVLLFTIVLDQDNSYFKLIDGEKSKFYDFSNLKIKTDAIQCKTLAYCVTT